nr:14056_t:CDS:2 [Entrophospora candida]
MSTIKEWLDDAIKNEHINLYEYDSFVDFELIGKGACGRVFRARSTRYHKTMALKELKNVSYDLLVNEVLEELEKVDINVLTDDDSSEINKNPGGYTNDNDNSQTKTSNSENEFEIPQTLSDTHNGYLNNYQPSSNPLSPMITENISRYIIPQELPDSSGDLKIYQPSSNPLSPMSTENNISRYIIPQELPDSSSDLKIYQQLSNLPSPTIKSKKEIIDKIIDKIIKENFNILSFTKRKEVSNNIQKSIEEQNVTSLEILNELISIQETSPIYLTLIGFFYYVGIGTPINKVESSKYFEKSNNLKEPTGQAWLGHLYENGEVGAEGRQDIKKAFELYLDSANQNNAFGQYRAGCCYSSGKGISRNTCEATKLLKAALNNGETQAKPRLELLEKDRLKKLAEKKFTTKG